MAGLVVVEGPNRGAIHALRPDRTRLGRDPACEVVIHDERASRVHAEVLIEAGRPVLVDGGSTNGTLVNGVACDRAALAQGDEVRIGDVSLLFVDDAAEAAAAGAVGRTTRPAARARRAAARRSRACPGALPRRAAG